MLSKAEERIQGEVSVFCPALSTQLVFSPLSHPLSSLLSVGEQACQSSSAPSTHLHNVRFSGLGRLIIGTFLLLFTANPQAEKRAGVIAGEGF